MHELEPISYCSIEEYLRHREKRIQASDVALDGLYMVLADIRRRAGEAEAFKFPVRAKKVDLIPLDFDVVTVDLLDYDLQPVSESHFVVRDGIVRSPSLQTADTGQSIKELYLKDYEDFAPAGPGEATMEDEIYSRELVVA